MQIVAVDICSQLMKKGIHNGTKSSCPPYPSVQIST